MDNEIIYVVAILAAFLLGAYIRKPFVLWTRRPTGKGDEDDSKKYAEKRREEEWSNLFNYTADMATKGNIKDE